VKTTQIACSNPHSLAGARDASPFEKRKMPGSQLKKREALRLARVCPARWDQNMRLRADRIYPAQKAPSLSFRAIWPTTSGGGPTAVSAMPPAAACATGRTMPDSDFLLEPMLDRAAVDSVTVVAVRFDSAAAAGKPPPDRSADAALPSPAGPPKGAGRNIWE